MTNASPELDRRDLPPELQGQAAYGFAELDFSSLHDEIEAAETGVIPTGELSDEARAALPEATTTPGYDASKDHPNQKGGWNYVAYDKQTPAQRAAMRRGIALARELSGRDRATGAHLDR